MSDIHELERRLTAALERIGQAIDAHVPAGPVTAPPDADAGEIAALREQLQAERDANAQLAERLRGLKERDQAQIAELQERADHLARQLDEQGIEVKRMRKSVVQLRETVRAMREAQADGVTEPHLINTAMMVELESLRATRQSELLEMDEILAELKPLIGGTQDA
jgi:methyl-accepting chemotaxis protein